jgi:tetratricopeptide (TPR) repeat protein
LRTTVRWAVPFLAAALCASCVHERRVAVAPPSTPTVWERQVQNAVDAGDGDYALKSLRERVAAEPENVAVRLELARAYRERGYPEIGLDVCRLAVARFPESAEAQFALARALYEMRRPADALAVLVSRPRESAQYFSWLGLVRDASGEWTAGEAPHRRAVALAPLDDALHNNLGYNLLMQERHAEAAAAFREAVRLNPRSQVARNNLGLALASVDTAQAVSSWQAASDPATAHNNLAAVWIEQKNWAAARKELAIALSYNKSHPAALRNVALVAQLDGNPAGVAVQGPDTRWDRWKAGFKRLFVGPLNGTN